MFNQCRSTFHACGNPLKLLGKHVLTRGPVSRFYGFVSSTKGRIKHRPLPLDSVHIQPQVCFVLGQNKPVDLTTKQQSCQHVYACRGMSRHAYACRGMSRHAYACQNTSRHACACQNTFRHACACQGRHVPPIKNSSINTGGLGLVHVCMYIIV